MKLLFFFLLISISGSLQAQRFQSFTSVGLLSGESKPALELQTVNGIRWGRFFGGAGVGVDEYSFKTVPVFADGRYFFSKSSDAFVFAGAGSNFPLKDPTERFLFTRLRSGFYSSFGIGHETRLSDGIRAFFAVGHSYKVVIKRQTSGVACINCGTFDYEHKNSFGRITMKAGISF